VSETQPGERLYRLKCLGALAKLRKAAISCVMSVCLPVRMEQLGSHWTDFHILYLYIFRKSVEKIQISLKSDNNNGTLHEDPYTFMIISR
jgi:hypothetical protein